MCTGAHHNPIRVLHVVGDSRFGGIAQIIIGLGRMAASQGWSADVLTTDPVVQEFVKQVGMGIVSIDVVRRPIRPWDLVGLVRLWRFLRRNRYHVVHTHTSKGGFVGRLAAWWAGVPVILHTAHGFAFHERSPRAVIRFYTLLERFASWWCDRIITVSNFHRCWALDLAIGDPEQIVAIPNGTAAWQFSSDTAMRELRLRLGIRAGELMVFTNTRLAHDKGIEHLVEAAGLLQQRGCRFRLVVAGDGPLRERLEQMVARLDVGSVMQFLGFRQDVGDLLGACDLVVFPSLREGLSISLLEAMAAGKPIVATSIGSVRDVAGQTGALELVPPADPIALADALHNLGRNRVRQASLSSAARELFDAQYTEQRMLNGYRDCYLELLQRKLPKYRADAEHRARPDQSLALAPGVREASVEDLPGIVSIHQRAFSDFFLTRLGPKFLRRYYELVLEYRSGIVLAREKDGTLQGFVCGFLNPPEFYRLMWRNRRAFMLPALTAVLRDPSLTRNMLSGIQRLQSSVAQAQPATCELSSIAVTPKVSGNGVGKSLVQAFLAESWNMQAECVSLTTDADDNDAANRLYHETGFSVVRRFLQRKGRWMNEYVIQRPPADSANEARS